MELSQEIELKFVFGKKTIDRAMKVIKDNEGQSLGFSENQGNQLIFTKDGEGVDVAIEHCFDGSKIFHLSKDSKGLPAMHEFKPDGTEIIYLFGEDKNLEKMVEMKSNGDKLNQWFSSNGDLVTQEQRQRKGMVFSIRTADERSAMVKLNADGSYDYMGPGKLLEKLAEVFDKFLDGIEFETQAK